jgi:hypothetical protein
MPRIRTIKPEFWSDYRMSRMPTLDRLVFIALWSMADDAGRIEGDADTVWRFANLREEPREAVESALERLASDGRITCYRTMGDDEGTPYIAVVHWRQHQRIDHPSPSKLPPPPGTCDDDGNPREESTNDREDSRPRVRPRGPGSGIRDQGPGPISPPNPPAVAGGGRRGSRPSRSGEKPERLTAWQRGHERRVEEAKVLKARLKAELNEPTEPAVNGAAHAG